MTTALASHALHTVGTGMDYMFSGECENQLSVAMRLLNILGAIMDEYTPAYFTDEETDFISDTTLACLEIILQASQQENIQ